MEETILNMPLLVDDFPNLEDAKSDYRNMMVTIGGSATKS